MSSGLRTRIRIMSEPGEDTPVWMDDGPDEAALLALAVPTMLSDALLDWHVRVQASEDRDYDLASNVLLDFEGMSIAQGLQIFLGNSFKVIYNSRTERVGKLLPPAVSRLGIEGNAPS